MERDKVWTHYERLGVEEDATTAEIRAAHRRKVAAVHPDRWDGPYRAALEGMVKDLNAARDVLLDPTARERYDAGLARRRDRGQTAGGSPTAAPRGPTGARAARRPARHERPRASFRTRSVRDVSLRDGALLGFLRRLPAWAHNLLLYLCVGVAWLAVAVSTLWAGFATASPLALVPLVVVVGVPVAGIKPTHKVCNV